LHSIAWGVTDSGGNGSGIGSRWFTINNTAVPTIKSVALNTAPSPNLLTWVVADPGGYHNIQYTDVIIGPSNSYSGTCAIRYTQASNTLQLFDDNGVILPTTITPGSSTSVSNSQCVISGAAATINNNLSAALGINNVQVTLLGLSGSLGVYVLAQNLQLKQSQYFQQPQQTVQIPLTCGTTALLVNDVNPPGSTPVIAKLKPSGASAVVFNIGGTNLKAYAAQVPGVRVPGTQTFQASIPSGNLLGPYSITPVISNTLGAQLNCPKDIFTVDVSNPPPPGPVACPSMTGNWTDSVQGQTNLYWSITDTQGVLSGYATSTGVCNVQIKWNVTSSTYSNHTYVLNGENPNPPSYECNGQTAVERVQYESGILNNSCTIGTGEDNEFGPGGGIFANTLTVAERIPAGEVSAFVAPTGNSPGGWQDQLGFPTVASFNMTLNIAQGSLPYDFSGRTVQELRPTAQQTPQGYAGNDGCTWPGAPWFNESGPFTQLGTTDTWNVQENNANGSYGPDYLGFYPDVVGIIQNFAPTMTTSPYTCFIQYPQLMVINNETAGTAPEPYGMPSSGLNLLLFTFTPNTVTVSRGGGTTGERVFYFQ
jgi:hypothetical protein